MGSGMFSVFFCNRQTWLPAYGLGVVIGALWVLKTMIDVAMNEWVGKFFGEITQVTNTSQPAYAHDPYHNPNTTISGPGALLVPPGFSPAMNDLLHEFMWLAAGASP